LPSLAAWQQHDPKNGIVNITPESKDRMMEVIESIQQRVDVPGLIDVQRFETLDDIIDYFEVNNEKNKYSAVVIDYLGRIDPVGNFRNESDMKSAKEQIMRKAFMWVGRVGTFVLISPFQVNREAHKAAVKQFDKGVDADGDILDIGYTPDCLFGSSVAQQDVDLVISVFSPDGLKADNNIMVQCLKYRGTEKFTTHFLKLDARTKYVYDDNAAQARQQAETKRREKEILADFAREGQATAMIDIPEMR
jgi:hypothetical protein